MESILSLHLARNGKVSDKWESYFEHYEMLFSPFRKLPISLVEIGVQNGGSLETWSEYFLNARRIVGIDIDPRCAKLIYDDSRIDVVIGDCTSSAVKHELAGLCPAFDIFIDDGSHTPHDIIKTFLSYFPLLKPGGLYIVEDCHTLYMARFGAGLSNGTAGRDFFKMMWDLSNSEFWEESYSVEQMIQPYAKAVDFRDGFDQIGTWIKSVYLANSFVCVSKANHGQKAKIGRRLVSGCDRSVQNWGE